ncbi:MULTISPECIES: response regulator [Streptacidiphilus]|uniref:Transcriptional regulatory protein n=1 Tax=Streptacidiphilus cavernicola TaxID=3342716 RepID=A0ABV6UL32_9ACTN|nr:response regulator [Streptacidiphilus jeojiense]
MISVLVVDDDFRVGAIHARYVARTEGFTVVGEASTVRGAVQAARELQPDLLLLDVYLPDGSGLDVLHQLAADAAGTGTGPDAIVITGARELATVRSAMKLGAVGYLVKPFGFAAFSERLAAFRELHQRVQSRGPSAQTDQAEVDALFNAARPTPAPQALAKGLSAPTLALVREAVRERDLSAAEVAEITGVSRPTAQRYLSYLVRDGLARLELRYGSAGRPEHRYRAAT